MVGKQDWVHKIIDRLSQKLPVGSPADSLFSPTFIDDAVAAIAKLVTSTEHGIWHVGSAAGISPLVAARTLAVEYGFDPTTITETTYDTFYEGRAPVPKNGVLSTDKITKFGVALHTFEEGVKAVHAYDLALPV
jgi:dTDP-4-dehydrorhamnose reductase